MKNWESKSFEFKVDDAEITGTKTVGMIRGLASTFGNIDLGDDIVDEGAFKQTIKANKGKFPILADHNPSKQIGWNLRAEETDKGLLVEGEIDLENPDGRSKYNLARRAVEIGAKMGLSIGYTVVKAMPDKDRPRVRRLKELKLFEYSLVTFPMNTEAMVNGVKQFREDMTKTEFLNLVRNRAKELGIKMSDITEMALQWEAAEEKDEPRKHSDILRKMDDLMGKMKI